MMPATQTAVFTTTGSWICPPLVGAVWLTIVGGGGGTPGGGDHLNFAGASGGGGSAELTLARPISVVPGNTYTVTIGSKGIGSGYGIKPTIGSASSFGGFNALQSGNFLITIGPSNAGNGGGAGGSTGWHAGGGFIPYGRLESCHSVGGCGGGGGGLYIGHGDAITASNGGQVSVGGATGATGIGGPTEGGGPGGSAIWGGTQGAAGGGPGINASATHYGAGAGGAGEPTVAGNNLGGNGANGYVLLMWIS